MKTFLQQTKSPDEASKKEGLWRKDIQRYAGKNIEFFNNHILTHEARFVFRRNLIIRH
jgi:hypothetical protein